MTRDAVAFCMTVIGEVVMDMDDATRSNFPSWKRFAGLTECRLLTDYNRVWDLVEIDLPVLLTQVRAIQAKLSAAPQNTSQDHPNSADAEPT